MCRAGTTSLFSFLAHGQIIAHQLTFVSHQPKHGPSNSLLQPLIGLYSFWCIKICSAFGWSTASLFQLILSHRTLLNHPEPSKIYCVEHQPSTLLIVCFTVILEDVVDVNAYLLAFVFQNIFFKTLAEV